MKKIEAGDRVKFLNDTGEGVVVKILDREMVLVCTDEDGFEYPVLKNELLVKEVEGVENLPAGQAGVEEVEKVENLPDGQAGVEEVEEVEEVEKVESLPAGQAGVRKGRIEEVDLHIKEIVDDYQDMTSGEMLEIQLARFRTALEGAIRARQKKIIFIHGKGAGKLKYEIQKIIKNEYKRCRYQDASFREYGYGATLILIS